MAQPSTTTNIRLPTSQWRRLKSLAVEEGLSLSGLVREMAAEYIQTHDEATLVVKNDSFFRIGDEPSASGDPSISEQHDDVLYSKRKPAARAKRR